MKICYLTSKSGGLLNLMCQSNMFTQHNLYVASNKPEKIQTVCEKNDISLCNFSNFDDLDRIIQEQATDIVFSAGFLKIIPKEFVDKYYGKIINIHPGTKGYEGIHPQKRQIADNSLYVGQFIHLLDNSLDEGPLLHEFKVVNTFTEEQTLNDYLRQEALSPLSYIFDNFDTITRRLLKK